MKVNSRREGKSTHRRRIVLLDGFTAAMLTKFYFRQHNCDGTETILINTRADIPEIDSIARSIVAENVGMLLLPQILENPSIDHWSRFGFELSLSGIRNERQLRSNQICQMQASLKEFVLGSTIEEIWWGSSTWIAAIGSIFPRARLVKIDHGLGDFIEDHNSRVKPVSHRALRRVRSQIERRLIAATYVLEHRKCRSIRLSDLEEQLRASAEMEAFWNELVCQDSRYSPLLGSNPDRMVILLPPAYIPIMTESFNDLLDFVIREISSADSIRTIVLKAHQADSLYGASEYAQDFAVEIEARLPKIEVQIAPVELVAELVVAACRPRVLIGVMSTVLHVMRSVTSGDLIVTRFTWREAIEDALLKIESGEFSKSVKQNQIDWLKFSLAEYNHFEPMMHDTPEKFPRAFIKRSLRS